MIGHAACRQGDACRERWANNIKYTPSSLLFPLHNLLKRTPSKLQIGDRQQKGPVLSSWSSNKFSLLQVLRAHLALPIVYRPTSTFSDKKGRQGSVREYICSVRTKDDYNVPLLILFSQQKATESVSK